MDSHDKNILIRYYKCECFGQVIDWMNNGMKENAFDDFKRLYELRQGIAEQLISRCTEPHSLTETNADSYSNTTKYRN